MFTFIKSLFAKKRRTGLSGETKNKIIALRNDGLTYKEIAKTLGITTGQVSGVVFRRGKKSPYSEADDQYILANYSTKTARQIARDLGRTEGALAMRVHFLQRSGRLSRKNAVRAVA